MEIDAEAESRGKHKRTQSEHHRLLTIQSSDSVSMLKKKEEEEDEKDEKGKEKRGHRRTKSTQENHSSLILALKEGREKYEKEKEKDGLPSQSKEHVLAGYLDVKHDGARKRKWVVLDQTSISIYDKKPGDGKEPKEVKVELISCSMKRRPEKKQHFYLITPQGEYSFKALHMNYLPIWTSAVETMISNNLHESIGSRQKEMVEVINTTGISRSIVRRDSIIDETDECRREFRLMSREPGNDICADCGQADPEWISLNLGIFICIECSGAHRKLGTHISKVRSINYDILQKENVEFFRSMGNINANRYWEYNVGKAKPKESDSIETKSQWIQWKYSSMAFINQEDKDEITKKFQIQPPPNT